jgi:hypothetical protein
VQSPSRCEEQQLSQRFNLLVGDPEKCLPNLTAERRTAGLEGREAGNSSRRQSTFEQAQLGRLAAAINAFKTDELAAHEYTSPRAGVTHPWITWIIGGGHGRSTNANRLLQAPNISYQMQPELFRHQ